MAKTSAALRQKEIERVQSLFHAAMFKSLLAHVGIKWRIKASYYKISRLSPGIWRSL